ncbi:hypothetical protein Hbl1158_14685 [Halobaculum sp. CBA1158]|uniref:hypothetical protein n=1 Tax=Halobaculum sp. CBA1158 TaxID=2904243 RepID=UPI001F23E49D|nr:hypothetical protein [Halobaculum sp. CBA1158]UIO99747.1 hypothetical protein Hbl1158_14685 [Halobaculum sp. CBA1158]
MTETAGQFGGGLSGSDGKKLIIRFLAILLAAPLVGWMMARAWVPNNLIYDLVGNTVQSILEVDNRFIALQVVGSAGLGLYLGFLLIFLIDIKKRVQGTLLLLGTVLGLVVLTVQGVLLPNIDLGYVPNVAAFALAFLAAIVLDIDKLFSISLEESTLKRPRTASGEIPEFTNTARALFGILSFVIVLSLVQVVLAGVFQPTDAVATVVMIFLLYKFIQYEVKSSYMMLGPSKSGKSMAMLGMALKMYDTDDVQPDPNPYLQRAIERASDPENAEDWPFPQTEQLNETSFQMLVGNLFPRRMRLVAYDYPGQLLPQIADRVEHMSSSSTLSRLPFLGGDEAPDVQADGGAVESVDDQAGRVASDLLGSDILMVVIDCERLVHPQEFDEAETGGQDTGRTLGIEYYKPILENSNVEHVVIAVTKADVLIHDESIPVQPPSAHGGFTGFKSEVNELLGERYDIQELKQALEETEVQPVFYKTEKRDGEYVPLRDASNNLIPVGYDNLIESIQRGA